LQRVAEQLVKRGHTVTVVAARHHPALPRDETIGGIRIVRLWPALRVSRGMVMPAYPWALWFFLRTYDVVWLSTPMLETSLAAVMTGLMKRGLISTHHGDLVLPTGGLNRFISNFTFWHYKYMAKRADRLIAYSQDYADHSYYLHDYLDKVRVISPPILIPDPDPAKAGDLRAAWSPEGGPILGFAGRFVREKRPDLAIQALNVVKQHYPNVKLVFAGQHEIRYEDTWEAAQPLVERYAEHLIFLGELDDPHALANYYAALDALVLTSDSECFALVQVEAMLCGTPVIMTDTPGGRVPVQTTGMGKLAPMGDAARIGRAIVEVLQNRDAYVKPKAAIEATFSLQATVEAYEEELYRAAERHGRI
jgi:glycosyltransferase involved in cell wall biosynthesis